MKDRIIIALDFDNLQDAKNVVDMLGDAVFFKVGLQAFLSFGDEIIEYLKKKNKKIFLDLKFKDIPNTVEGAVKSVLKYEPDFLTIHTTGGAEMIKIANKAVKGTGTVILGVTILTSMSDEDLSRQGIYRGVKETVLSLCELGIDSGLNSFVCSPQEISMLKEEFADNISLITPGIRPEWAAKGDQKRVFTPEMAMDAGADYLVIGRPITKNEYPDKAFNLILEEIEKSQ